MALTLAVTGWFLCRDYARFLRTSYTMRAKVTSMQQVFVPRGEIELEVAEKTQEPFLKNGFYPVIEYRTPNGPVSFTAIDASASGRFHVGDELRLRVSTTRRKHARMCKSFSLLVLSLVVLAMGLLGSAVFADFALSYAQIVAASFVIALGLAILVLYLRDRDENCIHEMTRTEGGRSQLCLFEPAAFHHWKSTFRDRQQRYKIRSSQIFGSACFGFAMLTLALAIQPTVFLYIPF